MSPTISLLSLAVACAAAGWAQSSICASCHGDVWRGYQKTGMARSLFRPSPSNTIEDYTRENTYYHRASDMHYAMIGRDGKYFQRQYQLDAAGRQINVRETGIDYVLGSGNHARAYLHREANGTLILLPLGWYAENGGTWAMNPGYDRPDHQALTRKVTYDCMFCHNAYPRIPEARNDPRAEPVFASVPEGIDCQRCHGDGANHVKLAATGAPVEQVRAAIVNPSRLDTDRQMEVCMQCHLETTSSALPASIVRYDRGPFSYRPGEPLGDFMLHFDEAPGTGYDDKFEITGSVYRLRKSQCFLKSNGALTCTTCHDPHSIPRGAEAAEHYNSVCRQCHASDFARTVAEGRHTSGGDCIGCHMPKRRTDDVVHAVMTDHRIARRPGSNLLAEKQERRQTDANAYRGEVVLYDPPSLPKPEDELYLAVAQVSESSNLERGIPRLEAAIAKFHPARAEFYLQLADALANARHLHRALPVYEEALRRDPASEAARVRLAMCLASLRQYPQAEQTLREALKIAPEDAAAWVQLGLAELGEGRAADAIAALRKATEAGPGMADAFNLLGGVLFETGDAARGEAALREAVRVQPNFAPARNNLGTLLSETGRFDEARDQFEAALRYRDNYVGARYNYALALNRAHQLDQAREQLEAILRVNPQSAEAHEFLGNLLRAQNRPDEAIREYREALRLRPDFARADLDLGVALAGAGKIEEALELLRKAAAGNDAETRNAARGVLEKLRTPPR